MTRTVPTDMLIDHYAPLARKRNEALAYVLEALRDPTLDTHTREILVDIELRLK